MRRKELPECVAMTYNFKEKNIPPKEIPVFSSRDIDYS
jgi:hypothetical protein